MPFLTIAMRKRIYPDYLFNASVSIGNTSVWEMSVTVFPLSNSDKLKQKKKMEYQFHIYNQNKYKI